MLPLVSAEARASTANRDLSSNASASGSVDTRYDAPLVHSGISRSSTGESIQNANVLVQNNTNQNGLSIFQGYSSVSFLIHSFHDV